MTRRISVIGLGYVGLPVAVAFAKRGPVVGYDVDASRIAELQRGHDRTNEVDDAELAALELDLTCDPAALAAADFHIVAVPTPIDEAKQPDFGPLLAASETVGARLSRGDIVVYESTVYPGATEERCIPVLERVSGLSAGRDFGVGYSPERINPGDRAHRFESIVKVVSGLDAATVQLVADTYATVVKAGVFRAASVRAAEAAKVIENTQRDLNIALMNELSLIFSRMGLDTRDVLEAARTKWNFLPFEPGLVGGHCIGVDPYYLTHKATVLGHHPQVILAGRQINDGMGAFVAQRVIKATLHAAGAAGTAQDRMRVTVLGLSFKEDVPDLRNTKVIDVVRELEDHGLDVQVHDPLVDPDEARRHYGVRLRTREELLAADAVVLAVAHAAYVAQGWRLVLDLLRERKGVVFDVRGVLDRAARPDGVELLRL